MSTITTEALQQAAQDGLPLAHLTAGQVYAANKLNIRPESLHEPINPMVLIMMQKEEQKARDRFFGGVQENDADEMISRTFDPDMPAFCRVPMRQMLNELMAQHFPDLKPDGVNDDGEQVFSLASIARNLGTTEETLWEVAEEKGVTEHLHAGHIHKVH